MNFQWNIGTRHYYFITELVSVCYGFKSRHPGNIFKITAAVIAFCGYQNCHSTNFTSFKRRGRGLNSRTNSEIRTRIALKRTFLIWSILNAALKKRCGCIPAFLDLKGLSKKMFKLVNPQNVAFIQIFSSLWLRVYSRKIFYTCRKHNRSFIFSCTSKS